jgi:mRNA interferase MazF
VVIRRGEIWWADLPIPDESSAPGYRRPVLILQGDHFNASRISTVIVASISSNLRLAAIPPNIQLHPRDSRLPKPSVINLTQIAALDKADLTKRVAALPASLMRAVDEGMRLVLEL